MTVSWSFCDAKPCLLGLLVSIGLFVAGLGTAVAATYNLDKDFDELTAAEQTAAKQAALHKQIRPLTVCADPGNMPFSNRQKQGINNEIAQVLAHALNTQLSYYWLPYLNRGLTSRAFGTTANRISHCDLLMGIPEHYAGVLTSEPIYRTAYVFAYRQDSGIHIQGLDDPALKKLRVGVYETSGLRAALARHGLKNGLHVLPVSHSTDLNPETAQWRQVQQMARGTLDVVGVWGPFAGYVKTKRHAPIVLQPANMMSDQVPLEFSLAIGVRQDDVVLKYALDNALQASQDKIKAILDDFGVPLVHCSRCIVAGDLPSHGTYGSSNHTASAHRRYLQPLDTQLTHIDKTQVTPAQIVTRKKLEHWLAAGADINAEFAHAVTASDPARIKFLAAQGAALNKRDAMGATPLTSAAGNRDSATLKLLLELGANVNARDGDGWTPLMEAAYRDHVPSVQLLARHGAKLQLKDRKGLTALCIAVDSRSFLAAKTLLASGAAANQRCGEQNVTPLMLVATHAKAESRESSEVDHGQYLSDGISPLEIGQLLIKHGADVNAHTRDGATALMIAAAYDHAPMIGLLVQSGATLNSRSNSGKTALDVAQDRGSDAAIKTLKLMAQLAPAQGPSQDGQAGSP